MNPYKPWPFSFFYDNVRRPLTKWFSLIIVREEVPNENSEQFYFQLNRRRERAERELLQEVSSIIGGYRVDNRHIHSLVQNLFKSILDFKYLDLDSLVNSEFSEVFDTYQIKKNVRDICGQHTGDILINLAESKAQFVINLMTRFGGSPGLSR